MDSRMTFPSQASRAHAVRPYRVLVAAVGLLSFAGAPGPAAADGPTRAQQLEQKAPTVVCVKVVLTQGTRERRGEFRGVTVDPSGLVMGFDFARSRNPNSRVTPTSVKVLYGNEAKEHEAVL